MKIVFYLLLTLLVACGNGQVVVKYHEIELDELYSRCAGVCSGFSEWDAITEMCDIYMLPINGYSDSEEYHRALGHEMRHCVFGEFH